MISLVVPTFNRPDFAIRTLDYYAAVSFGGEVLLGDSSTGPAAARIRRAVERLSSRLRVQYVECQGIDDRLSLHRLSMLVRTKYATFIGDDDIVFPSGLDQCVRFLERHPEFEAANGEAWAFELSSEGAYGRLRIVDEYPQPDLPQEKPLERLEEHFRNYRVTLFSVHRTDAWRAMWRRVGEVADRAFSAELLPCCLSPILGRIRRLDIPFLLRQTHASRYQLPKFADWLGKPDWRESHDSFCRIMGEHLAPAAAMTVDQATATVARLFADHYVKRFRPADADAPAPSGMGAAIAAKLHVLRSRMAWRRYSRDRLRRWREGPEPFRSDFLAAREVLAGSSAMESA